MKTIDWDIGQMSAEIFGIYKEVVPILNKGTGIDILTIIAMVYSDIHAKAGKTETQKKLRVTFDSLIDSAIKNREKYY